MSISRTVFWKEFRAAFSSPLIYGMLAMYLAATGALFFGALHTFEQSWTLPALWSFSVALPLPFLSAAITMSLFAGERSAGTLDGLSLLPVRFSSITTGKFWASYLVICLGIISASAQWVILEHAMGDLLPSASVLALPLFVLALQGFTWTAIGVFASAWAPRPSVAGAAAIMLIVCSALLWTTFSSIGVLGTQTSIFPLGAELADAARARLSASTPIFHLLAGMVFINAAANLLEFRRHYTQ